MFIMNSYWYNIISGGGNDASDDNDVIGGSEFFLFSDDSYFNSLSDIETHGNYNTKLDYIGEPHNSILIPSNTGSAIFSDNLFSVRCTPKDTPEVIYFEVEVKPSTILYSPPSNCFYGMAISLGSKLDIIEKSYRGSGILLNLFVDFEFENMSIKTPNDYSNKYSISINQRIGIVLDQVSGYVVMLIDDEMFATPAQEHSAVGIAPFFYITEGTDLNGVQRISDVKPFTVITDRSGWTYSDVLDRIGVLQEVVSLKEANQLYSYVDMLSLPADDDDGGGYDGELPV